MFLNFCARLLLSITMTAPLQANTPIEVDGVFPDDAASTVAKAEQLRRFGHYKDALALLAPLQTSGASLARGRLFLALKDYAPATQELAKAEQDPLLARLASLERALIYHAQGDYAETVAILGPELKGKSLQSEPWILALSEALSKINPERHLEYFEALYMAADEHGSNTRSRVLADKVSSHLALKQDDMARMTRLKQFLDEPNSRYSPRRIPKKSDASVGLLLRRAERLLEAHHNDMVLKAVDSMKRKKLSETEQCRARYLKGVALRKLRKYKSADKTLQSAIQICRDNELPRKALYTLAKVKSIYQGLKALPTIEKFAKEYKGHSMVDDVLFWGGDLHQRRRQYDKADTYYKRIESMPVRGDYCGPASWRRAWMKFKRRKYSDAYKHLEMGLSADGCIRQADDRAQAIYWMGRIAMIRKKKGEAINAFHRLLREAPLTYYAQIGLDRLTQLRDPDLKEIRKTHKAPKKQGSVSICPGELARHEPFQNAMVLLSRGLVRDAGAILKKIPTYLTAQRPSDPACSQGDPGVLLALLIAKSGMRGTAHWRLRTRYKDSLRKLPTGNDVIVFRAAYPLAFRMYLGRAEKEFGVPAMFLQALSREESAFNPGIKSWAGAHGLTQLMLPTAKSVGKKLLKPAVKIEDPRQLYNPALNARLGGALMGSLLSRFKKSMPLSLVAYNASSRTAASWEKRYRGQSVDYFIEEISIKETRKYVKRVMQTYGIYRWLYMGKQPSLSLGYMK